MRYEDYIARIDYEEDSKLFPGWVWRATTPRLRARPDVGFRIARYVE